VSDQLSLQRLLWLIRSDVLRNSRGWLVTSGTVALVALLFSWFGAWDRIVGPDFYDRVFVAMLFGWGTITTSQAFTDLHGRNTNAAFLLLPASALEKTAARLLLYTVGLFIYLLIFTSVLSFALEGINALWFGVRRELFLPIDRTAWWVFPHYIVVQGLFFLGAAWFRRVHFVKTVGAVLGIWVGLVCIAAIIALVLGAGSGMWFEGGPGPRFFNSLESMGDGVRIVYHVVLPAFCWFVAWLRVTETQVSHGI